MEGECLMVFQNNNNTNNTNNFYFFNYRKYLFNTHKNVLEKFFSINYYYYYY